MKKQLFLNTAIFFAITGCQSSVQNPTPAPVPVVMATATQRPPTETPLPTLTSTPTLEPIPEFQMTNTAVWATLRAKPPSTPEPFKVTYIFEDQVSEGDRAGIQKMFDIARQEFDDVGNFTVYSYLTIDKLPSTVDWRTYAAVAYPLQKNIYVSVGAYERSLGNPMLYSRMPHEYYHLVQGGYSTSKTANWLIEGSAEYKAYRLLDKLGIYTYKEIRGQKIGPALLAIQNGTTLDLLNQNPGARQTDSYTIGFFAVEMLTSIAGEESLNIYWKAISSTSWEPAFRQAFGLTVDEFYQRFNAWSAKSFEPQLAPK